jgi:hypothetical protein
MDNGPLPAAVLTVLTGARLSPSNLAGLGQPQLELLRNTVYARHGRPFQRADLQQYFNSQSWYQSRSTYTDGTLTENDQANIRLIQAAEAR